MDQAWVSQLKGQYCPFSLVSSGSPFQDDLIKEKKKSKTNIVVRLYTEIKRTFHFKTF